MFHQNKPAFADFLDTRRQQRQAMNTTWAYFDLMLIQELWAVKAKQLAERC